MTKKSLIELRDYYSDLATKMKKQLEPETKKCGVVQNHHILYGSPDHPEQEVVVKVFKGEHLIASRLRWYTKKHLSAGFVRDLDVFLALNRHRAEEIK